MQSVQFISGMQYSLESRPGHREAVIPLSRAGVGGRLSVATLQQTINLPLHIQTSLGTANRYLIAAHTHTLIQIITKQLNRK